MACPTCGGTRIYRKSNVVFEVHHGAGVVMVSSGSNRWLRCTLDVCEGCGRVDTFVQDPMEWLQRVGYDAVFDTGPAAG